MRVKDEQKRQRLFDAAVKVFSRYGVEGSSISRIARSAGLSPATTYVYFSSKQEMFAELVLHLGKRMSDAMFEGVDHRRVGVRAGLRAAWYNLVNYIIGNFEEYLLFEQHRETRPFDVFAYSLGRSYYDGLFELFERGRGEGILANISDYALRAHLFAPAVRLAKHVVGGQLTPEQADLDDAFARCWGAVSADSFGTDGASRASGCV